MKNTTILLLLLFNLNAALGSELKITGVVYSQTDSMALGGAVISVLYKDSVAINRSVTEESGRFIIQITVNPEDDNVYSLQITYLGYEPDYTQIIGNKNQSIDLGKIYLRESSTKLTEIIIKADRVNEKSDRMIVMPTKEQLRSSVGSMDLLNNMRLPGLVIDVVNQRAKVDGLEPVYMINGREQSWEQVVGIAPDRILRVEYSHNIPIRYLNQNVGGVINVILKEIVNGGSGYMNVMASPFTGFINGIINSTYNFKNSELSLLYNNNWRNYSMRRRNRNEKFIMGDDVLERVSNGQDAPFGYLTQNIDLSYTLISNSKNMFNVVLSNQFHNQHDRYENDIVEISLLNSNYHRSTKFKYKGYTPSLDIYYSYQLGNEQLLEFNVVGTHINSDYGRSVLDNDTEKISNEVDNERYSIITEGIYTKPYKKTSLSLGARNIYSYTKNEYFDVVNSITRMNINDTYLYGQFNARINKISFDVGAGLKIYDVNSRINHETFYRPMVTANMLYPLTNHFRISYRFQLRPFLPSLSQLSDVVQSNDSILLTKGNPSLEPYNSILNRILFIISKNKFRMNIWASYNRSIKPISTFTYWDEMNNSFISQYFNHKYSDKLSVQIDLSMHSLWDFLSFNLSGGWNKFNSAGQQYKHSLSLFYWNGNVTGNYKDFTLSLGYTRPNKNLVSEIITSDENYSYATLMYRMKQLTFTAGVYYPLTKAWHVVEKSLSKVNPYSQITHIKNNGNMFVLGFSYSLQYGRKMQKVQKGLNNGDSDPGFLKVE